MCDFPGVGTFEGLVGPVRQSLAPRTGMPRWVYALGWKGLEGPLSPSVRIEFTLERKKGFEPSTPSLARRCSTTEPLPLPRSRLFRGSQQHPETRPKNRRPACRLTSTRLVSVYTMGSVFCLDPDCSPHGLSVLHRRQPQGVPIHPLAERILHGQYTFSSRAAPTPVGRSRRWRQPSGLPFPLLLRLGIGVKSLGTRIIASCQCLVPCSNGSHIRL